MMSAGGDIALVVVESLLVLMIIIGMCRSGEPERENNNAVDGRAAAAGTATAPAPSPVEKLPYFPYSADGSRATSKACAICLELLRHGELCSEVPACRHSFHRDCLGTWMTKSENTCPLCRGDIVTGSERASAADTMV